MKTILVDVVISVLLATVAVALVWIVWEAVVTTHADPVAPRVVLESLAFLPVAVFIFVALALMSCGLPIAAALVAYASIARSRPVLQRARSWIPLSLILGLAVGGVVQAVFGDFWTSVRAGVERDERMSSVVLGSALSFVAFVFYRYRLPKRR